MNSSIAKKLVGYTFQSGWRVICEHNTFGPTTGGVYSMCFDVEKDGKTCFMKAFDFATYMLNKHPNEGNPMSKIKEMVDQYNYEYQLSNLCRDAHVTKVVFVIYSGAEYVENMRIIVPYLIFEMADGDMHQALETSDRLDFAWKLKSLHDIAVGLMQLHKIGISHQDVKPSNILIFELQSKLGDLGCALCDSIASPFGDRKFIGDHSYAPPERYYKVSVVDDKEQKYLTDCYLLGSLMTYYLTGVHMNALLYQHLPESLHYNNYQGRFVEIKTYLNNAFRQSLEVIRNSIPMDNNLSCRLLSLIEYLCNPFVEQRGHPKDIKNTHCSNYNLERFISDLAYIQQKAELLVFRKSHEHR